MNIRREFIAAAGLDLSAEQLELLEAYAALVWQKKDDLNLTSVSSAQEIWDRHITDGLFAAALIKKLAAGRQNYTAADYGTGCGYIGISVKIALGESCFMTLIETLNKRCMFMDWCLMKLNLSGIKVLKAHASQKAGQAGPFDFTMERAMGKLEDVLPICCADLKSGGYFMAFQSREQKAQSDAIQAENCLYQKDLSLDYRLFGEDKTRQLAVFKKV